MPERDTPNPDATAPLGDLFDNLPTPAPRVPGTEQAQPAPGSRRARREAAKRNATSARPDAAQPVAPQPAVVVPSPAVGGTSGAEQSSAATQAAGLMPSSGAEQAAAHAEAPRTAQATAERKAEPGVAGSGTLEELFHAEPHDDHAPGEGKRKRRTGCIVALVVVLAIIGGLVGGGVWAWNTYGERISEALGWGEPKDWEPGLATGEAFVTINEGDTGEPVSKALHEAGVTKTEEAFYDYLIEENIAVTFYPGVYKLQQKMTSAAALEALRNPANKLENTVSVPEGTTVAALLPGVAETMGIPLAELQTAVADPSAYGVAAENLEGWLFPAVYTFDPGVTATDVIATMVDRTRESLTKAGVPAGEEQRILTIASIIQREGRVADFAKVSRVIQNRLDIGMKLQMDSTAQYGYGELHAGSVATSEEAQHDPNKWNTYVHEGLPATPISTASDAAIQAAMHPEDGPWLYFVTVNPESGETVFSETYEQHQAAIEQWADWCRANGNPSSGCSG